MNKAAERRQEKKKNDLPPRKSGSNDIVGVRVNVVYRNISSV